VNGDMTPVSKPADTIDCVSDNGPIPTAERCRLSESGDRLHNDVGSPLSATSPVSENGEECFASVAGQLEDCTGIGMFAETSFQIKIIFSPTFQQFFSFIHLFINIILGWLLDDFLLFVV